MEHHLTPSYGNHVQMLKDDFHQPKQFIKDSFALFDCYVSVGRMQRTPGADIFRAALYVDSRVLSTSTFI
jgi:hypothetical protein